MAAKGADFKTIGDLVIILEEMKAEGLVDDETPVYLSSDEEGNSFCANVFAQVDDTEYEVDLWEETEARESRCVIVPGPSVTLYPNGDPAEPL